MKKITLFVLALGLTMGVMAQKNGDNLTPMKVKNNVTLTKDYTLYPNSFNNGITVDSAKLYFANTQQMWTGLSGSNSYGDVAYAQVYNIGWNVPVKGIAAIMGQMNLTANGTNVTAALHSATATTVGNEISNVAFNTNTISDLSSAGLALQTFTLPAVQNLSNFAVAINVPEFTLNSTQDTIISDFLFIATTPIGKASGEKSFSLSYPSETATAREWITINSGWSVDLDMMIFPIINGAGLNSNIDVNTLTYVYPNPAKDQVVLASSFNMNKVEIFNMIGQKVYENTVNGITSTVNVAGFTPGTYMVKMFTEGGLATKKIVVE